MTNAKDVLRQLKETVKIQEYNNSDWYLMPWKDLGKVDVEALAKNQYVNDSVVYVCRRPKGSLVFCVSAGDMKMPVGSTAVYFSYSTSTNMGDLKIENIIKIKDKKINATNDIGLKERLPVLVFK